MMRALRSVASSLTALLLCAPLTVRAQGPNAQDTTRTVIVEETALDVQVREVASELRCVVCQGLSLQDSPSELAQEMRAVIREKLEEGMTPAEVKAYFVGRYGEFILLEPEPHGFNLAIYILPVLVVLVGAVVVFIAMRRWTGRPAPSETVQAGPVETDPELAPWEG